MKTRAEMQTRENLWHYGWLNVRMGRYAVQCWKHRVWVLRMDDAWMAKHGKPWLKVWQLLWYRS